MKYRFNKLIKNIKINILKLTHQAKSAHLGSCLSIVEILTVLYFYILKKKDRFILSKGHSALALYSVLSEKNIISKKKLFTYGKNDSLLMNHASHKVKGVEFSTGSLGHGLPVAVGKALKFKLEKKKSKVYVLLSDGELNEGSNWEALLFASHHKLNNLVIIIDYNKIQSLGHSKKIINIEPLKDKFISFGCRVAKINGHSYLSIKNELNKKLSNKPKVIIANTIKGYDVNFMEDNNLWHYKSPNNFELEKALKQINKKYA